MPAASPLEDKLGICQWFHFEDHASVERSVELLAELGVRHLRTGISWADHLRPGGKRWYDWMLDRLSDFEVLLSVWHTPPSLAEGGVCAGPPRRLQDYADFIDQVISEYGDRFADLELWNEPNNRYKWAFDRFDPDWSKFSRMIGMAAHWARERGRRTVLGGMIPVDEAWLRLVDSHGALGAIDVVAIHGFPGMWWDGDINWEWKSHWDGWSAKLETIEGAAAGRPIWITETGLATWDLENGGEARLEQQVERLRRAAAAPVPRVYWYCLVDLDPEREAIEGFHVDENEYHLGLVRWDGSRKPAWYAFAELLAPQRRAHDSAGGRIARTSAGRGEAPGGR